MLSYGKYGSTYKIALSYSLAEGKDNPDIILPSG